jgi:hypothetical protein
MPVGTIVRFAVVFLFSATAASVCIAAPLTKPALAPSFDCKAAHVHGIDVISEVPSEAKTEHLRRYVDESTWENASPWAEEDFTGSDFSISVDRVPLYDDRPESWALSTVEETMNIRRFWLFESSSDGKRSARYIGQVGGDNALTNNPLFTRFRGHPYVIEGAVEFETARSQFAVYDLDPPRNVCAGREPPGIELR